MIKSDKRCEPMPAHSIGGVGRTIHAEAGAAHDENQMKVGATVGIAIRLMSGYTN
ncbi:hypothetical protein SAMN05519105_4097 [Rhodobacter sp. 24-YEA-8]|nr:hypothetical protein SAMN05519105_4097 [Rhodobacter sp. 24-YEA-8]